MIKLKHLVGSCVIFSCGTAQAGSMCHSGLHDVSAPGCILSSSCIPTVAAEFCIHPLLCLATAPWFTYPEANPSSAYYLDTLAKRPNLGIALGGGGYRAVTTALGYIRLVRTGKPVRSLTGASMNVSWGMKPSGKQQLSCLPDGRGYRTPWQGNGDKPWIHQVHTAARMPRCKQMLTDRRKHERHCELGHETAACQMAGGTGQRRWALDTSGAFCCANARMH
jgi:hypothetical protein